MREDVKLLIKAWQQVDRSAELLERMYSRESSVHRLSTSELFALRAGARALHPIAERVALEIHKGGGLLFMVRSAKKSVRERLQACIDDPMWFDHAEVSKATLRDAIAALPGDA